VPNTFWKAPAWQIPVRQADRVAMFRVPDRDILSEEGWPESFWSRVETPIVLTGHAAAEVVQRFSDLESGESARCHIPPWGLAMYDGAVLLFTVTLCFECFNAYVYTAQGKELRAFDISEENAVALLALLRERLPLT